MGYVKYFVYKGKSKVTPISIEKVKESPRLTNPSAMHSMPGIYVLNLSICPSKNKSRYLC